MQTYVDDGEAIQLGMVRENASTLIVPVFRGSLALVIAWRWVFLHRPVGCKLEEARLDESTDTSPSMTDDLHYYTANDSQLTNSAGFKRCILPSVTCSVESHSD